MARILLDVDYCIALLHDEWLSRYNRDYNDSLTSDDITAWKMDKFVKPECGAKIYAYLNQPDLYNTMGVREGALEAVQLLRSVGHDVRFVTSGLHAGKINFLYRNGFIFSDKEWVILYDKSLIIGDYLVDDYEGNFVGFQGTSILFNAAHNQKDKVTYRAYDWNDVLSIILSLETK